jgi:ribosome biogenesis GTPase
LLRLGSGFLIDSPGISEFALNDVSIPEIAAGFPEIPPLGARCRFTDCSHRVEPGCAVREAAETGAIAESRYTSYLGIVAREHGGRN